MSMSTELPGYLEEGGADGARISRRAVLIGGILAAVSVAVPRRANASVMRALTLTELVQESAHVFIGTPSDAFSQWENLGGQKRIVTYNLVDVESSIDGRPPATASVMVRTLGGVSGNIGQVVPGEAPLRRGTTAAMFIEPIGESLFAVTAMSQGHYVLSHESTRKLQADTRGLEMISPQAGAAVTSLDGRTVSEAEALVYRELTRGAH
jgi:hypothetical protein